MNCLAARGVEHNKIAYRIPLMYRETKKNKVFFESSKVDLRMFQLDIEMCKVSGIPSCTPCTSGILPIFHYHKEKKQR